MEIWAKFTYFKYFYGFQLIAIEIVDLFYCFVKNITNINKLLTTPVILSQRNKIAVQNLTYMNLWKLLKYDALLKSVSSWYDG